MIVGHQYGGGIAAAVAARYPLLWGGLCVIDSPVISTQREYSQLLEVFSSQPVRDDLVRRFRLGATGVGAESRERFAPEAGAEMARDWLSVPRLRRENYSLSRSLLTDEATGRWVRQPTARTVFRLTTLDPTMPLMPGRELLERVAAPVWVLQPDGGDYARGFAQFEQLARTRLGWAASRLPGGSFVSHTDPELVRDALVALLATLPEQTETPASSRWALAQRLRP